MAIDRPGDGDDRPDSPRGPESHGPGSTDVPSAPQVPDLPDRATYWAEYKKAVDAEYRAYAIDKGCDRVRETEETIVTPAIKRVEAEDPDRNLVGFEFRLKARDRIEEKVIIAMSERGRTADQAFTEIKDAIRYTFCYPDDKYAEGVRADVNRLKDEGFELAEFRNTWINEEYKGINSRWQIPESSQLFEVQFHTETSFAVKQETHEAYERLRTLPPDHEEVHELRVYQRQVSGKIPIPAGATELLVP